MVSLIVPVFQEAPRLARHLGRLSERAAEAGAEIVVVDGGSTDGSRAIVRGAGAGVRLVDSMTGRGRQLNTGARVARGALLAFVPADCVLPPGAIRLLSAIERAGQPAAGGFRVRFDARRTLLSLVAVLHNWRAAIGGVFYLDQVPFVRRELFLAMGGFLENISMEDVEFGTRLRSRVRARSVELVAVTSARRFDRHGDLRTVAEAARILGYWALFGRAPRSRIFFDPLPPER